MSAALKAAQERLAASRLRALERANLLESAISRPMEDTKAAQAPPESSEKRSFRRSYQELRRRSPASHNNRVLAAPSTPKVQSPGYRALSARSPGKLFPVIQLGALGDGHAHAAPDDDTASSGPDTPPARTQRPPAPPRPLTPEDRGISADDLDDALLDYAVQQKIFSDFVSGASGRHPLTQRVEPTASSWSLREVDPMRWQRRWERHRKNVVKCVRKWQLVTRLASRARKVRAAFRRRGQRALAQRVFKQWRVVYYCGCYAAAQAKARAWGCLSRNVGLSYMEECARAHGWVVIGRYVLMRWRGAVATMRSRRRADAFRLGSTLHRLKSQCDESARVNNLYHRAVNHMNATRMANGLVRFVEGRQRRYLMDISEQHYHRALMGRVMFGLHKYVWLRGRKHQVMELRRRGLMAKVFGMWVRSHDLSVLSRKIPDAKRRLGVWWRLAHRDLLLARATHTRSVLRRAMQAWRRRTDIGVFTAVVLYQRVSRALARWNRHYHMNAIVRNMGILSTKNWQRNAWRRTWRHLRRTTRMARRVRENRQLAADHFRRVRVPRAWAHWVDWADRQRDSKILRYVAVMQGDRRCMRRAVRGWVDWTIRHYRFGKAIGLLQQVHRELLTHSSFVGFRAGAIMTRFHTGVAAHGDRAALRRGCRQWSRFMQITRREALASRAVMKGRVGSMGRTLQVLSDLVHERRMSFSAAAKNHQGVLRSALGRSLVTWREVQVRRCALRMADGQWRRSAQIIALVRWMQYAAGRLALMSLRTCAVKHFHKGALRRAFKVFRRVVRVGRRRERELTAICRGGLARTQWRRAVAMWRFWKELITWRKIEYFSARIADNHFRTRRLARAIPVWRVWNGFRQQANAALHTWRHFSLHRFVARWRKAAKQENARREVELWTRVRRISVCFMVWQTKKLLLDRYRGLLEKENVRALTPKAARRSSDSSEVNVVPWSPPGRAQRRRPLDDLPKGTGGALPKRSTPQKPPRTPRKTPKAVRIARDPFVTPQRGDYAAESPLAGPAFRQRHVATPPLDKSMSQTLDEVNALLLGDEASAVGETPQKPEGGAVLAGGIGRHSPLLERARSARSALRSILR